MRITVIAHADRVGTRPDRLAYRLARDPNFKDASLVVYDATGVDVKLAGLLAPYPHLRWAVVRPAEQFSEEAVRLDSVRPADRWVFLPADAVPLGDTTSLLAGGEADAAVRAWDVYAALVADDLCSNLGPADWDQSPATLNHRAISMADKNWQMPAHYARTICLADAKFLLCGPAPDLYEHVRPETAVVVTSCCG